MSKASASVGSILRRLGYEQSWFVADRTSIADLFGATRRCGVYVLEFANGEVYGGQAVDVTRRYVQHLRTHSDIQRLFFKRVPKAGLNDFEKKVIQTLERSGHRTRNIIFASIITGERDLDLVMAPEAQARFENDLAFNDASGRRTNDVALRRKLDGRYSELLRRPHADVVSTLLREYVPRCVPAFVRSELSFWSLSIPRRPVLVYARVNVGWQEVLTAFEEDGTCWFTFHVARSPLGLKTGRTTFAGTALSRFRTLRTERHAYEPGGQDQAMLIVEAGEAFKLVRHPVFAKAARRMNLRLMRKSPTPYGNFHCFALADRILSEQPINTSTVLTRRRFGT
jgi:hypothetical protein